MVVQPLALLILAYVSPLREARPLPASAGGGQGRLAQQQGGYAYNEDDEDRFSPSAYGDMRRPNYEKLRRGDLSSPDDFPSGGGAQGLGSISGDAEMDRYRELVDEGERRRQANGYDEMHDWHVSSEEEQNTKYGRNFYAQVASKIPWNSPDRKVEEEEPEPSHPSPPQVTRALLRSHSLIEKGRYEQELGTALEFEIEHYRDATDTVMALEAMSKVIKSKVDRDIWTTGQAMRAQTGHGRVEKQSQMFRKVKRLDFTVVQEVGCGAEHMVALSDTGNVYAWGDGTVGQLSDTVVEVRLKPYWGKQLRGKGIKKIFSGGYHNLAIDKEDKLWSWGMTEYGQLCRGKSSPNRPMEVKDRIKKPKFESAAAGLGHTLALLKNGSVIACGMNENGQLGVGGFFNSEWPKAVFALEDQGTKQLAAGCEHSLALTSDGKVWSWGKGAMGQLGHGDSTAYNSPRVIGLLANYAKVKYIAAGCHHSFAVTEDNVLWAWGHNRWGQLGLGDTYNRDTPRQVGRFRGSIAIRQIDAGRRHSALVTETGRLWVWGMNKYGQLGIRTDRNQNAYWKTPQEILIFRYKGARQVCASAEYTAVVVDKRFIGGAAAASKAKAKFNLLANQTASRGDLSVPIAEDLDEDEDESFESIRDRVLAEEKHRADVDEATGSQNVQEYPPPIDTFDETRESRLTPEERETIDGDLDVHGSEEVEVDASKAAAGDYEGDGSGKDVELTEDEDNEDDRLDAHHPEGATRAEEVENIMAQVRARVHQTPQTEKDPEPAADAEEEENFEEDEARDVSTDEANAEATNAGAESLTADEDDEKEDPNYALDGEEESGLTATDGNGARSTGHQVSDQAEVPPDGASFDEGESGAAEEQAAVTKANDDARAAKADALDREQVGDEMPTEEVGDPANAMGGNSNSVGDPANAMGGMGGNSNSTDLFGEDPVADAESDDVPRSETEGLKYACPRLFPGLKPSRYCHEQQFNAMGTEVDMHPELADKIKVLDDFVQQRPKKREAGIPQLSFDYYDSKKGEDPQLEPGTSQFEMIQEANRAVNALNSHYLDMARGVTDMKIGPVAGSMASYVAPAEADKANSKLAVGNVTRFPYVNVTRKSSGEGFDRARENDDPFEPARRTKAEMQEGEINGRDLLVDLFDQRRTQATQWLNIEPPEKINFLKKLREIRALERKVARANEAGNVTSVEGVEGDAGDSSGSRRRQGRRSSLLSQGRGVGQIRVDGGDQEVVWGGPESAGQRSRQGGHDARDIAETDEARPDDAYGLGAGLLGVEVANDEDSFG